MCSLDVRFVELTMGLGKAILIRCVPWVARLPGRGGGRRWALFSVRLLRRARGGGYKTFPHYP